MKNVTADFFNSYSEKFNAIYGEHNNPVQKLINHLFRKTMILRFDKTLESCQPVKGKSVLDVGCGPGHYCLALAKLGAAEVLGIDFAPNMIEIATNLARNGKVDDICRFEVLDFFSLKNEKQFDYIIFMGFMDYISDPLSLIKKAIQLSRNKVLFSFPADDGILAWQRKIRYKKRCPLFLYNEKQLRQLFSELDNWTVKIDKLSRDYFVSLERKTV